MAIPWFLRSSWRLFGTLFLILALPMAALLGVVGLHARAELHQVAVANVVQGARLVTTSIEEELYGTQKYVESYARRARLVEALERTDLTRARRHLQDMLAQNPKLSRVILTDPSGTVIADHPSDPSVLGRNFSRRDWYRGAAARPGAYVSEIYRRAASGRPWVVAIACGVALDVRSPPAGFLVAQWSLDDLVGRLAAMRPSALAEVLLVDPAGQVLARGGALPLESPAAEAALAAPGREYVEVGDVLAVSRPLAHTGWHVVVERPLAATLDPVRSITRTALITFAASLVAMFIVGGAWYRTLRQYDLGQRRALEAVRASEAALASSNEELERRVAERTAELHAARTSAEDANRLKDEFLAVVSHELRTPLTPILAWTHLLRARRDEATLLRGLEVIERNAMAQAHIVSDLLDISRIVTGKLGIAMAPLDLADVVRQAVETVRAAANGRAQELRCELEPALVRGDAERLKQVAWNLLSNAIKFTPRGGRISVEVRRSGSHAQLRVTDSGEGIESDFLPLVFGRFTQGERGASRSHGGLGLGLAISRQLVEAHGGSISAESAGKGQGSTFSVLLPLAPLTVEPDERPLPGAGGSSLEGLRVLVVEDESDAREVVALALTEAGAEVVTAGSGEEALALLAGPDERSFEVLVSDIGMAHMDGLELVRRVRGSGQELPAVALTAYARAEDRRRCLDAGFQEHLSKPVDPARLVDVVARAAHRA